MTAPAIRDRAVEWADAFRAAGYLIGAAMIAGIVAGIAVETFNHKGPWLWITAGCFAISWAIRRVFARGYHAYVKVTGKDEAGVKRTMAILIEAMRSINERAP